MKQRIIKDTHVYLPVAVLADLKKLAKANRRSMTAEIQIAVERRIQEWKDKQNGEAV